MFVNRSWELEPYLHFLHVNSKCVSVCLSSSAIVVNDWLHFLQFILFLLVLLFVTGGLVIFLFMLLFSPDSWLWLCIKVGGICSESLFGIM